MSDKEREWQHLILESGYLVRMSEIFNHDAISILVNRENGDVSVLTTGRDLVTMEIEVIAGLLEHNEDLYELFKSSLELADHNGRVALGKSNTFND